MVHVDHFCLYNITFVQLFIISYCLNYYREKDVRVRSGPDAGLYLTMELYLLAILAIFTVFSIGFILPINYLQGNLRKY